MRRAVPAVIISILGLVALATFKTSPASSGALGRTVPTTPSSTAPSPTTDTTTPATSAPATGGTPSRTTPKTSPPATAPPPQSARTVTGQTFENQYGPVQVQIRLQCRTITDVQAVQLPSDRARSQYISEQAGPLLRQEALQAQSAQIDGVSGATYTSESYAQSLQSALDSAGI